VNRFSSSPTNEAANNVVTNDSKNRNELVTVVRTGRLRDSIFSRVQGWELKFGATAPYAEFQEFGTSRIQSKRFLSQAVEQYDSQLEVLLASAVEEAVRETST
jgi:HK97 gp10 family phage protein